MARRMERDKVKIHTLPSFIAVFVSVLCLSESATPKNYSTNSNQDLKLEVWGAANKACLRRLVDYGVREGGLCSYSREFYSPGILVQQPATTTPDTNRAVAGRALREGFQLFEQGTAASLQQAIEKWQEARQLYRAAGDKEGEATTLLSIGRVYDDLGDKQQALNYYNQALLIFKEVGDRSGEALTLNNIAAVYHAIGQPQQALEFYNQALPIRKEVGNRSGEATTLHNIAAVYDTIGQPQKALEFYNQALPIFKEVGDRSGEAATLNNIAAVYYAIGQPQKALEFYNSSLPISKEVGNRSWEATTLNNIGEVYRAIGQPQKALEFYNSSLPIRKEVGNRSGEATTLHNIAAVYDTIGQPQKALEFYNQALPIRKEVGDHSGEATTLNNIGSVYRVIGQPQQALEFYYQALPIRKEVGDRSGEATTLSNIAYVERDRGNLNAALTNVEAAIKIVEDIRTNLVSQELRTSYFATVQSYYELKIDILMQLHLQEPSKGYNALALETSERARARSLLELLTEANADIRTGVDPKLLEQERTLLQQLNAKAKQQIELFSGGKPSPAQVEAIAKEIDALNNQLQELQTEIRIKSPRYANLKYPQPLTLKEIQQQVLDKDSILLEYSLGKERSYLWAVTSTSITSYELPKQEEIEKQVQQFYPLVTDKRYGNVKEELAQASTLSQILLKPVAAQLGKKRLVIVSNGVLQTLPFGALPALTTAGGAGGENTSSYVPLLVEHEIITLPSASTLAVNRKEQANRQTGPKTLAILADPVFSADDERLKVNPIPQTTEVANLNRGDVAASAKDVGISFPIPRLAGTGQEAKQILALVPTNERQVALGFQANLALVNSPQLSQYQIVHFGTHGFVNNIHPELSGIVLSLVNEKGEPENGFLRLNEVFNLNLPADLVVLSACQTGKGKDVSGEGLVGLTRGFMYAGASRVVVSLWYVDDEATAELMTRFYRGMLQKGLKPAAALRAAQVEMSQQEQWRSPAYWAAFVVQGEWK